MRLLEEEYEELEAAGFVRWRPRGLCDACYTRRISWRAPDEQALCTTCAYQSCVDNRRPGGVRSAP